MCNNETTLRDLTSTIGLVNTSSQTVLTGGTINIGTTYRQYTTDRCGKVYLPANGGLTIQRPGIYRVTANLVGTGTVAGDVTVQLFQDGVALPGALATETITTAGTEIRTFPIDYKVLVNNNRILNICSTPASTLTLVATGVGATFTNVVFDVTKEV